MCGGMTKMYPDAPHKNSLQVGEEYQEIIRRNVLEQYKFNIEFYANKKEQYEIGESKQRIEIKLDSQLKKYGHLSIEVAEKSRKDIQIWTPSGIFRNDNTKWYIHGDYQTAWVFLKNDLKEYYKNNNPRIHEHNGTIKKFYIDICIADKLARRIIQIK
jgi:hypothetical protein